MYMYIYSVYLCFIYVRGKLIHDRCKNISPPRYIYAYSSKVSNATLGAKISIEFYPDWEEVSRHTHNKTSLDR